MKKFAAVLLSIMMMLTAVGAPAFATDTGKITAISPVDTTVDFHTTLQSMYLSGNYNLVYLYADGTKEKSKPLPVTFKWDDSDNCGSYTLEISENE